MQDSKIGWTHHTWNPWWGCNKVSAACAACYIARTMRRSGREPFDGPMRTSDTNWGKPKTWDRRAVKEARRQRVFTCSLSDFFHRGADRWRPEAWEVIRACENLDWLILTKRPQRILRHLPSDWGEGYANVWLGVTVEQARYLDRLDELARIPAAIRFVSAEPLLEGIDFRPHLNRGSIDWLITGCEKAHREKRRQMELDWVRSVRDQCRDAGVPHFFKQHYVGNEVLTDGILDGEVCHEWPQSAVHQ